VSGIYSIPSARRLRRSSDIRSVFRSGRRYRCGPIDLFLGPGVSASRAAIVVPRYGHSAVDRNRLKRRLREIVRLHWLPANLPGNAVFRARQAAYDSSFDELRAAVMSGLERVRC
jgi:ribonuclease P protein component